MKRGSDSSKLRHTEVYYLSHRLPHKSDTRAVVLCPGFGFYVQVRNDWKHWELMDTYSLNRAARCSLERKRPLVLGSHCIY